MISIQDCTALISRSTTGCVYVLICLLVCLSVRPSVYPSVCLSVCAYLSVTCNTLTDANITANIDSGIVIAVPIPQHAAPLGEEIDHAIALSLQEAKYNFLIIIIEYEMLIPY